jgi:hypothetical protein
MARTSNNLPCPESNQFLPVSLDEWRAIEHRGPTPLEIRPYLKDQAFRDRIAKAIEDLMSLLDATDLPDEDMPIFPGHSDYRAIPINAPHLDRTESDFEPCNEEAEDGDEDCCEAHEDDLHFRAGDGGAGDPADAEYFEGR